MNATSLEELRSSAANRDLRDEKMEQVRQLLYGDHARDVSTRFMLLETRLRELETGFSRQLEAISERLEALSRDVTQDRRSDFHELSKCIAELGDRIGGIGKR